MLLDRMVNLLSRGCVLPVMKYIKSCSTKGDTDISLIRYFVREVTIVRYHCNELWIIFLLLSLILVFYLSIYPINLLV